MAGRLVSIFSERPATPPVSFTPCMAQLRIEGMDKGSDGMLCKSSTMRSVAVRLTVVAATILQPASAGAKLPQAIDATGETTIAQFHGVGAQIYECKTRSSGERSWQFREPIATLLAVDRTMGRHFAGPTWELADGTTFTGEVAASTPGTTPDDIPWLRLTVTSRQGHGPVSTATTVQRINTKGGILSGACGEVGAFMAVPYAADYVFLRRN
jgi:hypothetical protein